MPSTKVKRAIKAFEKAVEDRSFIGGEHFQYLKPKEASVAYIVIQHNYVKARAKLERLMENL